MGARGNDLVPGAFGLVTIHEGVLGHRKVVDPDREERLSGVTGPVVDHGGERDRPREREEEMAVATLGVRQSKPSGGLFEGAIASDLRELDGEVLRDLNA